MKRHASDASHAGRSAVTPLPCACANLRRAARRVTQLYDQELRRAGMRATQFTLLQALATSPNISQGILGRVLGLDSTTLTRELALLRRKDWIQSKQGKDRRTLQLTLTAEGRRKYQHARPYWLSAQKRLRRSLGNVHWSRALEMMIRTAERAQALA